MNICYITSQLPCPATSGGAVKTLATLTALVREGHDVHLFCFGPEDWQDAVRKLETLGVRSVLCQPRELILEKAFLRHGTFFVKSMVRGTPYTLEKFSDQTLIKASETFMRQERPDVVWVDHFNMVRYLPSWFSGTSILEEHNIQSLLFSRLAHLEDNPLLRGIYRMESDKWEGFERDQLPRFSVIGTISKTDRDYLTRRYGLGNTRFLGTAIHPSYQRSLPKKQLLFVGRLTWRPNWQGLTWFLAHVWPKVLRRSPDYHLEVVGDYVRLPRPHPGVSFRGAVLTVEPYLRSSSVLICPIFSGSGLRVKILQALAAGLPVVSTTLGAEGIPVQQDRSALLADHPEDFVEAIERFLTQKDLRARLIREGKRLVADYYSPVVFQKRVHEFLA